MEETGLNEQEWIWMATHDPAFGFLEDPAEDIYTLSDGKPFRGQE